VCGIEHASKVLELNRLVLLNNLPNEASRLVAGAMRLLPKPSIVVSYADTAQDHEGIVYQATNFLYTGLSKRMKDIQVKGYEHLHHTTLDKGLSMGELKSKYGEENIELIERSRKHRYVKFVGNKTQVKQLRSALNYEVKPYPKPVKTLWEIFDEENNAGLLHTNDVE
jgi:hypothetical protein